MRIGAARDMTRRLVRHLDQKKSHRGIGRNLGDSDVDIVYQESNRLKHDLRGLSNNRFVTYEQAVQAFYELVLLLENRRDELSDPDASFPAWRSRPRRR